MRHTVGMKHASRARVGPYTWADFVALGEDDPRELIDGALVEIEVPKLPHEHVVARLVFFLTQHVMKKGAMVLGSSYKVRVNERRGVMPDVQLYKKGNEPSADQDDGLVRGRPDLVVEVMSASSRRYDRIVKLAYYAALGVPEYWLVDPSAESIERLVLTKTGYVTQSVHVGPEVLATTSLRGLRIPLADVWLTRGRAEKRTKPSVTKRG